MRLLRDPWRFDILLSSRLRHFAHPPNTSPIPPNTSPIPPCPFHSLRSPVLALLRYLRSGGTPLGGASSPGKPPVPAPAPEEPAQLQQLQEGEEQQQQQQQQQRSSNSPSRAPPPPPSFAYKGYQQLSTADISVGAADDGAAAAAAAATAAATTGGSSFPHPALAQADDETWRQYSSLY